MNSKKEKISTGDEFEDMIDYKNSSDGFKRIKKIINESRNKKDLDNKYSDNMLKLEIIKNDNKTNSLGNSLVSFNCNCIGKNSYKNTEAITTSNNNTSENNNNINAYFSTVNKTLEKSENQMDNRIIKSKTTHELNSANSIVLYNKPKNQTSFITKNKTYNKINSNLIKNKNFKISKILYKPNEAEAEKLCLDLVILNSWNLPIGLKLHIDKYGLANSIRNKRDGVTYFGYQSEEELNCNPIIDYLLVPKDQENDQQFFGKYFQIRFDENIKKYYIKDLGNGFGTFIKLVSEIRIKDNLLINIGETYIVFSFNNEIENELIIKIFTGYEQCITNIYNSLNEKCIIIGRDPKLCNIIIKDKMLSRIHCCINYKEKKTENGMYKGWYLKDGNLEGKKSTNDTWFYSAEETLIYDKMIFKANHNLFKCNYK